MALAAVWFGKKATVYAIGRVCLRVILILLSSVC